MGLKRCVRGKGKERGEGILGRGNNKYRGIQVHGEFKNKVKSDKCHKREIKEYGSSS